MQVTRVPAGYNVLARTGQAFPEGQGVPIGLMMTADGRVIPEERRNYTAKPQVYLVALVNPRGSFYVAPQPFSGPKKAKQIK